MKISYKNFNFTTATWRVIEQAQEILEKYDAQGYKLTLRQLYYQFVQGNLLKNTEANYKRLGNIISDARIAGEISWDAIEDRTRNLRARSKWDTPHSMMVAVSQQFHVDMWSTQPNRVEVWIEKDALTGVIQRVCQENDVPYFSCRGYTSQSEMHEAAMRQVRFALAGQTPHIIHLGDHDPSGMDMTRDIMDRLKLFCEGHNQDMPTVHRIALNMDQIKEYSPPPNPAKVTDSRFAAYQDEYGNESWELDALTPSVINDLIQAKIDELRTDGAAWDERIETVEDGQKVLVEVAQKNRKLLGA